MPSDADTTEGSSAARHRRPPSIRLRLTVWMTIIALVIQLTLGLVVFLYQASALDKLFDERIRERSEPILKHVETSLTEIVSAQLVAFAQEQLTPSASEPSTLALFTELQALAAGSLDRIPPEILPQIFAAPSRDGVIIRHAAPGTSGVPVWRYIARRSVHADGRPFYLVVGRADSTYATMIGLIRRVLVLSLPVGVIGAGVAGWLISGIAIAPVRRLRSVAGALEPESIEKPVSLDVGASELEDVQAAIEDVRERLRLAFVARDRFIGNVSHELKTPIAIILTEAQTLDHRTLSPDARAFVRSVIDEMRRLGRTIESFLTLTKIRAGKSLMEHQPCSVSDFVMDAVLGCSRLARQHKVTLNPLLADAEQPLKITGDCELLRVLVDNLIRNAIKYSPEGGQVIIHVAESTAECTIAVRDFGADPSSSDIASVFDPVAERTDRSRERPQSLGLSIAQTIARLHTGRLDVRNIAEGGCEMVVHLPRDLDAAPVAGAEEHAST